MLIIVGVSLAMIVIVQITIIIIVHSVLCSMFFFFTEKLIGDGLQTAHFLTTGMNHLSPFSYLILRLHEEVLGHLVHHNMTIAADSLSTLTTASV